MKQLLIAFVVMLLSPPLDAANPASEIAASQGRLESVWELVSVGFGKDERFTVFPRGQCELRILSGAHFTWIGTDEVTGRVWPRLAGTYTCQGNRYTEKIKHTAKGLEALRGQQFTFVIQVMGDTLIQSTVQGSTEVMREIWQRVTPPPSQLGRR
jgi:hypothetical protein